MAILEIKDLKTYFFTEAGVVRALDGVDLEIEEKETHGLVGESGSGKTVTALSALGVVAHPGKIVNGQILYRGEDILQKSEKELQKMRGNSLAISFQDPSTSLNPLYTIGNQLVEVIIEHQKVTKKEAEQQSLELLEAVGIPEADQRLEEYPHQFSMGMRQRVAIARALSCRPDIYFADEPTTALDVTIEAQILRLYKRLKTQFDMSMVMITHDMGVIAEMCNRVTVLYAGRVCETGDVESIYYTPRHPYTQALLTSVPTVLGKIKRLSVIPGTIPDLIYPPPGCRFHPRCNYATEECKKEMPPNVEYETGHKSACIRIHEIADELIDRLQTTREEIQHGE